MRFSSTLIVIVVALTLNLLGAGTAQAYEWGINGEELSGLEISKESMAISGGAFSLTVPKLGLTINCKSAQGTGEIIEGGTSSASITLGSCTVSGAEKACTVKSPEKSAGTLAATATTNFLEKVVGEVAKSYDEVTLAMTIQFSGEKCAFPAELKMGGATAATVPSLQEEAVERTQEFSQAIGEEAGVTSLAVGKNPAFLTGEDTQELTGAYANEPLYLLGMQLEPPVVFFLGTGAANSRTVTIHSISGVDIEIIKVEVSGPYTVTSNCNGKKLNVSPRNPCTVTTTCNTKPSTGTFTVTWRIYGVPIPTFTAEGAMYC